MPTPILAIQGGSLTGRDRTGVPVPLTGSGALRSVPFDGAQGWLVEEGTTNPVADRTPLVSPSFTTELIGSNVWRITRVASSGYAYAFVTPETRTVTSGSTETASCDIKISSSSTPGGTSFDYQLWGVVAGSRILCGSSNGYTKTDLSDGWSRYTATSTWSSDATSGGSRPNIPNLIPNIGDYLDVRFQQIEAKPYATTYCDGSLGTGYAWTGTANASSSTRAVSTLFSGTLPAISTITGSIYARYSLNYRIPTPNQYAVKIGQAGVADFIGVIANYGATQKPRMWSGVGATLTPFIDGPTAPTVGSVVSQYGDWTSSSIRYAINGSPVISAARIPAPSGSISGLNTVGIGVYDVQTLNGVIGSVLFFDQPLSDSDIAKLNATPTAQLGFNTLTTRPYPLLITI